MGWVKRKWISMAKDRGKIRDKVMREKVRGDFAGMEIDSRRTCTGERCWSSSGGRSISNVLICDERERDRDEMLG